MDTIDDLFIKRKVYISTVGWVSAIFSGLIIYFSVFGIINVLVFSKNSLLSGPIMSENPDIAQAFFKTYVLMFIFYGFLIVFGTFFLISSIGLIKYRDWGRNIFVVASWVLIVLTVSSIITYIFFSGRILFQIINSNFPSSQPDGFNSLMKPMDSLMQTIISLKIVGSGILLVVAVRALFRVNRRFITDDYKRLFN